MFHQSVIMPGHHFKKGQKISRIDTTIQVILISCSECNTLTPTKKNCINYAYKNTKVSVKLFLAIRLRYTSKGQLWIFHFLYEIIGSLPGIEVLFLCSMWCDIFRFLRHFMNGLLTRKPNPERELANKAHLIQNARSMQVLNCKPARRILRAILFKIGSLSNTTRS